MNERLQVYLSSFTSSPALLLGGGVTLIGALTVGGYFLFSGNGANGYFTVSRAPLEQVVEFSGVVVPKTRAELAFERSGRITALSYDTGDTVAAGAILASLDTSDIQAELARERAILSSEEVTLAQLKRGTREEELVLERARVAQYEQAMNEAQTALFAALSNSYTVANTTMVRLVDEIFDDPDTLPTLKHATVNRNLELRIEQERSALNGVFGEWEAEVYGTSGSTALERDQHPLIAALTSLHTTLVASAISSIQNTEISVPERVEATRARLTRMQTFLKDLSTYISDLSVNANLSQTTIDEWKVEAATERTYIANALTALNTASEKYTSAQNTLAVGQKQLALLEAGATSEDIAVQQARVEAQRATVSAIESEWRKYILRAPQSGTVTERYSELGELAVANEPVFILDATGYYEAEARISELDIVFLEVGQKADVTLDPYGDDEIFSATISHIDPAETVISGSSGYGITLTFDEPDTRLKAGMTANAYITILLKESALSVPIGYIKRDSDGEFVYVVREGRTVRQPITTGLRSTNGFIEVTSGLSEGDRVVDHVE